MHQIQRESLQSHINVLKAEIVEYETLIKRSDRHPLILQLSDIQRLPQIPIKGRIAAKITQKELAELAGLTEQEIKDYEERGKHLSFEESPKVIACMSIVNS